VSHDRSTVEAVVKNYFDGLYEGDADKLGAIFDTSADLRWVEKGELQVLTVPLRPLLTVAVWQLAEISSPVLSSALLSTATTESGEDARPAPNTSTLRELLGQVNVVVQNFDSDTPALALTLAYSCTTPGKKLTVLQLASARACGAANTLAASIAAVNSSFAPIARLK